jgi:hypothetical protein
MGAFRVWKKHWLLTAFLLILALAGAGYASMKIPRAYQAQSTVVLLPSLNSSKVAGGGNPYLNFSDSVATTANVVAAEMTNAQTSAALKEQGFSQTYNIVSESIQTQQPSPLLTVTVTGTNGASVENTLRGVTDEIGIVLNGLQRRMSQKNRITAITVSFAPQATLNISSTARRLIAILGPAIILALCIPLAVDGAATRRRKKRKPEPASSVTAARWRDAEVVNGGALPRQPTVNAPRPRDLPNAAEQQLYSQLRRSSVRGLSKK